MTTWVHDPVRLEVIPKEELARREAKRAPKRKKFDLPDYVERGAWVWSKGGLVPRDEYYASLPPRERAPMVMRDIGDHISPLDGTAITSRSQLREHMKRHGVEQVGTEKMRPNRPKPLPDPRIAVKETLEKIEAGRIPIAKAENAGDLAETRIFNG